MNKKLGIGVGLCGCPAGRVGRISTGTVVRESNGFRRISRGASVGGSRITDATAVAFRPVQGICPSD